MPIKFCQHLMTSQKSIFCWKIPKNTYLTQLSRKSVACLKLPRIPFPCPPPSLNVVSSLKKPCFYPWSLTLSSVKIHINFVTFQLARLTLLVFIFNVGNRITPLSCLFSGVIWNWFNTIHQLVSSDNSNNNSPLFLFVKVTLTPLRGIKAITFYNLLLTLIDSNWLSVFIK